MCVMNDRSQGGSAFEGDRIELMINRRGYTQDGLGNQECVNEVDCKNHPARVNAQFFLQMTATREQALDAIRSRYLKTTQPIVKFIVKEMIEDKSMNFLQLDKIRNDLMG